jgi:hypothetical protein
MAEFFIVAALQKSRREQRAALVSGVRRVSTRDHPNHLGAKIEGYDVLQDQGEWRF